MSLLTVTSNFEYTTNQKITITEIVLIPFTDYYSHKVYICDFDIEFDGLFHSHL